jgi:hypothetical protein
MQGVNEQSMDVSDQVRLVVAVFSRTVLTEPNDVVVIYECKHTTPCRFLRTDPFGPVPVGVLNQTFGEHRLGQKASIRVCPSPHMDRTQRLNIFCLSQPHFHRSIVSGGLGEDLAPQ